MRPGNFSRIAASFACVAAVLAQGCGGGGGGGDGSASFTPAPPPAVAPAPAPAPASPVAVQVTERTRGLSAPWALAFLPDGRILVTERAGTLKVLAADGTVLGNIGGVPAVAFEGQGGLLDVVLDPAFSTNRRIYLGFAERDPTDPARNGTAVARAELDLSVPVLRNVTVIYRQLPKRVSGAHFGSRLVFDRTGHLFVTLGERFEREFAQDLATGHGKVVRITTDGAPAPGNPVWTQPGAQPHIWSFGHRNPQGAALHPLTGELWTSEHGEQGGDEINRLQAGRNYGWPLATRSQFYETLTPAGAESLPGMEDPLWVWLMRDGSAWPGSGAKSSTAPAGMSFYSADQVPQWKGNLFVTALAGMALWRLTLDGNTVVAQERLLAGRGERMRDVEQGPDGALYILTDDGKLLRYGP
jgi:glucose/arabinose dehydrogenase